MVKPTYKQYQRLQIDLSPLGLLPGGSEHRHFCTPKGANIIFSTGSDGIHLCLIRGFGEMLFAVSPMNNPGRYVHPLAANFNDFLRSLLACGHAAVLEHAANCDQGGFELLLQENPCTDAQAAVLSLLQDRFTLTPMEGPFRYIRQLQAAFDYSRIKYTKEYGNLAPIDSKIPEWSVYFNGNFWGRNGRERAGTELPQNRQLTWAGGQWRIPSIYLCAQGLVIDICLQVPAARIRAFMDKWKLTGNADMSALSAQERMGMQAEYPLAVCLEPSIVLNGRSLAPSHSCSLSWNPCLPEDNGPEAAGVLNHYALDPAHGHVVYRHAFPWSTRRRPAIHSLCITLTQADTPILGPHIQVSRPGDRASFVHPSTGVTHTLTVQEYERQSFSAEHFRDQTQEFPTHYILMGFTLSPDLPGGCFAVMDCAPSDRPRQKHSVTTGPLANNDASAVGVIGGSDGPMILCHGENNQGQSKIACSGLHFAPVEDVEWHTLFRVKTAEDMLVELICEKA